MKIRNVSWVVIACAVAFSAAHMEAQLPAPQPDPLPQPPYAIVTYPSGDPTTQSVSVVSLCGGATCALVGLQPDEIVNIIVQYPTDQALQVVGVAALDGGFVLPPSSVNAGDTVAVNTPWGIIQTLANITPLLATVPNPQVGSFVISADGTLSFTFVAAHEPGRNKIMLRAAGATLALRFWVFDPNNPQNNPGCINPTTPAY